LLDFSGNDPASNLECGRCQPS